MQRFLHTLQKSSTANIPQLWTPITTKMPDQQAPITSTLKEKDRESQVPLDKEFLLPLKQNKDQLDILKSLETNDCVVVQGPPGTGKSHTIGEQIFPFLLLAT